MTSVLKIRMNLPGAKILTWTLQDPINTTIPRTRIETLVNNMINDHAISINGVEPESFKDAYIYQTNTIELI